MKLFLGILFFFLASMMSAGAYSDEAKPFYEQPIIQLNKPDQDEFRHVNARRKAKIDQSITEIEGEVTGLADSYKTGEIWKSVEQDPWFVKNPKYKWVNYPLMIPSYVARFITWPAAAAGNELIKHGVVRKVIDLVSNDERTLWFYPKVEFGFGSGFGGGAGVKNFDLFNRNYIFSAAYQIHVNMNQEASAYIKKSNAFSVFGKPVVFKVGASFMRHHNQAFYGLGPTSSQNDRSIFGQNEVSAGGWIGLDLTSHLNFRWNTGLLWNNTNSGDNSAPKAEALFPPAELYGFGKSIYYIMFGPELYYDTRDSKVSPERGTYAKAFFTRFQGTNTARFDFNQYNLSAAQYIKALMPRHVLMIRNAWQFQQETSGGVPFELLSKLDVNSTFLGFPEGRFTDRASVIFNLNYTYPIWKFLDGELFFDTGRVFSGPTDFSFDHFKFDGGGGLKLTTSQYFLMRFQIAYGGEDVRLLLSTSQEF